MHQGYAPEYDMLSSLLMLAGRPSTQLDAILQFSLEKALSMTASDIGGVILFFDITGKEPVILASGLRGELAEPTANLLKIWWARPANLATTVLETGLHHRVDDYRRGTASFPLFLGGRSSLWVPLLDAKKVVGCIHVESSRPRCYGDFHLQKLQTMAIDIVIAIERLVLREDAAKSGTPLDIVGVSPAFLDLERQIKRAAANSSGAVLITGERGSGKELASRAIHSWGKRRGKPFIPVLASTLTESLFADELFGHTKHAFTGAHQSRSGKFLAADGGTLFLDEVGDMPAVIQSSLLRVIERGEVTRVGCDLPFRVNVRVVAATNRDLSKLIDQGKFRADLCDRLSVFEIRVPALRERRSDIPLLVSHFLKKYCEQVGRDFMFAGRSGCTVCKFANPASCATGEFYQALEAYDWPGNVRELANLIVRLLATVPDEILDAKHLPEQYRHPQAAKAPVSPAIDLALDTQTRSHIERVLHMVDHNESRAARILGIPRSTLRSKIKKLGIESKRT
ncbi:MAG: sigma-54-dependent Fis family transcriptional regulator [Acidobacteriota bacterium]